MSDTLTDADLLSPAEVAPKAPKAEHVAPSPTATCPHCGANWTGSFRNARLANHVKAKHPEHWTGPVGKHGKAKGAAKSTRAPRQSVPRGTPAPARKPVADQLASLADGVLAPLASVAGEWEVANVLASPGYGPALGGALDGVLAGSALDRRVVQPMLGKKDNWGTLAAVLVMPAIVRVGSRNPMMRESLEPIARACLEQALMAAIPALKARAARQRKLTDMLAELGAIDPSLMAEADPVGALLAGFYEPPPEHVAPEPEPDGPAE